MDRNNSTLMVEGYESRLFVERGHLVVRRGFEMDGTREELRFPRGRCEVDRIIVRGPAGSITLGAIDWCARMGITLGFVASDSSLTNCLVADQPHDGPLKRAQAIAGVGGEALYLARYILAEKFASQVAAIKNDFPRLGIANAVGRKRAIQEIEKAAAGLSTDDTLVAFLMREGYAAKQYFELLDAAALPWPDWCLKRIPKHWAFVSKRLSGGRSRIRDARDPFNAILNYSYTLLEVETRIACARVGLDPDLGLLHVDDRLRESFIYDLMEPLRVRADVFALEFIQKDGLRPHMFHELQDGVVRLDPDFASALAKVIMPKLAKESLENAQAFAKKLRAIKVPYALVHYAKAPIEEHHSVGQASQCRYCAGPLPRKGLKFCGRHCYLKYSVEVAKPIEKARKKLAEMRAIGLTPGHGGEAAKKRGAKCAENNRKNAMQLTPEEMKARRALQQRGYRKKQGSKQLTK